MTADPALDRERRVGERETELVGRLEGAGEAEQVVLDVAEQPFGARDLEQRLGVRLELAALARHGCRSSLDGSGLRARGSSLPFPTELM